MTDNTVQTTTDTLNVWAKFPNPEDVLTPGGVVTVNLSKTNVDRFPAANISSVMHDAYTVSYTHLDVYKRQFRNDELLVNAGEPGIGLLKNSRELTLTDTLYALTPELMFDYLGVSLNLSLIHISFFAKTTVLLAKNGQTPQFWYEGNAGIYHPGETVYAWRQD